jgi:dihydroflavonol-4-reductase
MKIFISGATGFVGGHLAENLIKEGHEVKTLARHQSNCALLKELGVEITYGDISNYDAVKKAISGCELIYHAATAKSGNSFKTCYEVNIKGTDNIMRAALAGDVCHVVHCSSTRVYGKIKNKPADESEVFKPRGFYPITKLESDKIVLNYVQKHNISAVIARLTPIIGSRNLRWLKLFQDTINGKSVIFGSGEVYLQVTHINDIVEGLKLCAEQQSKGEDYIIGSDEYQSLNYLITTIAETAGVKCITKNFPAMPLILTSSVGHLISDFLRIEQEILHKIDFFTRDRMYSIAKAKRQLGFCPKVSLKEGIKRTLTWYQENGFI